MNKYLLFFYVLGAAAVLFLAATAWGITFVGKAKSEMIIAETVTCKKCRKPLIRRFIRVDGHPYHKACFVCEKCKKPLSGSFQKHQGGYYHPVCLKKEKGMICAGCGKLLADRWAVFQGKKYHKNCAQKHIQDKRPKCGRCGLGIEGKFISKEAEKFHVACYKNHYLPKCSVCSKPIEGRYTVDPWNNSAHTEHGGVPTIICSSCTRIISKTTSKGGQKYSDGRIICGYCSKTVTRTPHEIRQHKKSVSLLLESVGITGIPEYTPVELVEMPFIKKKSKSRHATNTKGFTQCITSYGRNSKIVMDQNVYILSGLPGLEFEGVLAHEFLHVWLNVHDIKLSTSKMEGFCNLGARLVYERDGSKLADVLLENMEKDPHPEYGRGYRRMKKKLEKLGWAGLLKKLK